MILTPAARIPRVAAAMIPGFSSSLVRCKPVRKADAWTGDNESVKSCEIAALTSSGVTESGACESFFSTGEMEVSVTGGGSGGGGDWIMGAIGGADVEAGILLVYD